MSFDPSDFSVKEAVKRLRGLDDSELEAVYDAEMDGRGRVSLLRDITSKRDSLREESTVEEPAPAAPAAPAVDPRIEHRPARPGAAAASYIKTS